MALTKLNLVVLLVGLALSANRLTAENWPVWRGPRGDGTSLETNVPIHWSSSSNLLWKTPLPGQGHASPIVFGNQVFCLSALPETQERVLISLDRGAGRILWSKSVLRSPLEKKHSLNSHASST